MSAPQWLIDRMEALKKLPPPTLEQVQRQFAASAKHRRENARCHKHTDYNKVNPPTTDCYGCWTAYTDFQQTDEAWALFRKAMNDYDGLRD